MAGSISREGGEPSARRSSWRLAAWGAGASLALGLVAAAACSEAGSRRLLIAFGSPAPVKGDSAARTAAPRAAETGSGVAEDVRVLAADRERLAARLSRIERHLDDLTGSIAAAQRPAAPGSAVSGEPVKTGPERPSEVPAERRKEGRSGTIDSSVQASSANESNKGEYGADIGSAASFDGLRALWSATKANNADAFENLYPMVSVQENSRTKARQLRLIVGPFSDWEDAHHFCAAVASPRLVCQPTGFDGQRLADADRPSERKPAAPRGTTRPSSSPPPRLFGLF